MYHAIVRASVRRLWAEIEESGDHRGAVALAASNLQFTFAGPPGIGVTLQGRDAFDAWFADVFRTFPGLRLHAQDIVVRGWPWRTTVIVRLNIEATLADGTAYRNQGIQWVTLRWGRMVRDEVLEDTAVLAAGVATQRNAGVARSAS